ncbi:hypothetical protein IW261DRAFT_1418367 [Armillaria novae-zelandiae]|uniref:Uncharacterized protein n=1 Tax=Armillaria novae-zelandiae TaxID=153914 RepID=A0AA39TD74_9AGAR|nr:hypothetical protein IW261DRAFT_1418365 [Armillaria novae-zelandiae]KAK0481256.1 hypothetical protein IW261DRAFT_1418367 [Armillaria novae-zelandiae]
MPTLTIAEELAPIFGQIESINILLRCWQAEFAAIKADQDRFELETHAYEQTNEFIRSLLLPENLPPSVAATAKKPKRVIQVSGVLAASKVKIALARKRKAYSEPLPPPGPSTSKILFVFNACQGTSKRCWIVMDASVGHEQGEISSRCHHRHFYLAIHPSMHAKLPSPNFYSILEINHVLTHAKTLFSQDLRDPIYQNHEAILSLLPYDLSPTGKKLFLVKQAKRELAWYERLTCSVDEYMLKEKMLEKIHLRHILGEHALSIMEWTVMYGRAIEVVNRKNRIFLKDIMKAELLKYIIVLSTPTMQRTLHTFNSRLTCLTMTVWQEIKFQVLEEYLE